MRRNDTQQVGKLAEDYAAFLLSQKGFEVKDLNKIRNNYPLYDLIAIKNNCEIYVSVKCAKAKRELKLGKPHILKKLDDYSVVMAFLPANKREEIQFVLDGYELLIIPGKIVREESLAAHNHYSLSHPNSANHSVMVKDKVDRSTSTRSGAVFKSWHDRFLENWDIFDNTFQKTTNG